MSARLRTGVLCAAVAALLFAAVPPATAEQPPPQTQQTQRSEVTPDCGTVNAKAGMHTVLCASDSQAPPPAIAQGISMSGWVRVGSLYGSGTQCLEATGGHDGAHARVWTCDGTSEQDWWRENDGTMINSRYPGKCLDADITDGGANGNWVQTYQCNGTSQQRWLTRADDVAIYNERFLNNYNTVLDRDVNGVGNGARVQLWQKNFQPQQWWTFF